MYIPWLSNYAGIVRRHYTKFRDGHDFCPWLSNCADLVVRHYQVQIEMGILSLIGWFVEFVEKATRPPEPPIDRTEALRFISIENLEQMVFDAKTFYKMKANDFNVAVVGAKSVGKSSLINGLLHFNDDDTSEIFLALGPQISHMVFS